MDGKLKIIIYIFISMIFEHIYAQFALPTFQAIHSGSSPAHPGFSVTSLSFDNDDRNNNGDDFIEIPWSTALRDYTISDSSAFTVTIRAYLPSGSHWVRKQCFYTSPGHSMRGSYYWDGSSRMYSSLVSASGTVTSDQERGTKKRTANVANHSLSWAGQYTDNVQMIFYQGAYYFWTGYRGTVNASNGVFTSADDGPKVWFENNYSYGGSGTNRNIVYDGNDSSSPTVLAENTASGSYDYVKLSYSNVSDFSSGNTGVIESTGLGATGVGSGSINYVLDIDGSNDYISLPNSINMGNSDFTLSLWIKTDDVGSRQHVFQQTGSNDNRVIAINSGGSLTSRLGGSGSDHVSGVTLSTDTWYHIAIVHDNSANTLTWYVNGSQQNVNTSVNIPSNTGTFYLGTNSNADGRHFNGQIDEVRIWNDIRTSSEIANNKDDELEGDESGLVAYYKMSDGSGTTLTDNSSNSNNGTLNNMSTSSSDNDNDWVTSNAPHADDNSYASHGPAGALAKNSFTIYKNQFLVLILGIKPDVTGVYSGTGYLGKLVGGGMVDINQMTEWALISYCDPADVTSLHDVQGNTDLRSWAPGRGKSIAVYYSLTNALSDGDTVIDLMGNFNGTARGL
tara:strand:- start:11085 stop:12944 length:1860 start_codon:yes stop_codon:yes gene_type:complete